MSPNERTQGALLGVAIGDAAGLPFEGLSAQRVARRFSELGATRLAFGVSFVSDDTEQTALVAEALARSGADDAACLRAFRRSMIGWFARLPFGIGWGTLRACVRMSLGLRRPGVRSAGNGAAMRMGIVGAHLAEATDRRRALSRALAQLTHADDRAVEAAVFVAEVSAACARSRSDDSPPALLRQAATVLAQPELMAAVDRALDLSARDANLEDATRTLGNSGFAVHSVGLCAFCFARFGHDPLAAVAGAIRAGGDTDTHAAIVGGWVGALHGTSWIPAHVLASIHDGAFGPTHLTALATALANGTAPPTWSRFGALLRNLALYPVVLVHGFAQLFRLF